MHAEASAAGKGPPYSPRKTPRYDPFTATERGRKKGKGKGRAGDAVAEVRAVAPTFESVEMSMEWWWLQKRKGRCDFLGWIGVLFIDKGFFYGWINTHDSCLFLAHYDQTVKEQQEKDAELAERINEEEYEATGNLIEW